MRITGDNDEGKAQLDNFIDPESTYPGHRHHLPAHVHRRRCPDLPPDRARQAHQLHDRVQADHRPRHPHQRGLQQALLHHHGFQAGHGALRRPGLSTATRADLRARPGQTRRAARRRPATRRRRGRKARTKPGPSGGRRDPPGGERPTRYYVDDVEGPRRHRARPVSRCEHGKLITESLKDYTRKTVRKAYASLNAFLNAWNDADRKAGHPGGTGAKGVFLDELAEQVGRDYDAFDLVCHVAFDQPPLTRRSAPTR
jgi:type I restriction enzyme R subunit